MAVLFVVVWCLNVECAYAISGLQNWPWPLKIWSQMQSFLNKMWCITMSKRQYCIWTKVLGNLTITPTGALIGWPYGPFLHDTSLSGFLYCLKIKQKEWTHLTCERICIALTVLRGSHHLMCHDWSSMYNAKTLYMRVQWQQDDNRKTEPNTEVL